ncbi:MAG: hypothetical protein PHQ23_10960 [Candidatus Wallbacteria bacterium]|nr:hypothetical protein [Candidatus Wallbacteria bacterium]
MYKFAYVVLITIICIALYYRSFNLDIYYDIECCSNGSNLGFELSVGNLDDHDYYKKNPPWDANGKIDCRRLVMVDSRIRCERCLKGGVYFVDLKHLQSSGEYIVSCSIHGQSTGGERSKNMFANKWFVPDVTIAFLRKGKMYEKIAWVAVTCIVVLALLQVWTHCTRRKEAGADNSDKQGSNK